MSRTTKNDEDYSFVSPVVKYLLFLFNMIFWIIALVLISIGVYSRIVKYETALACLTIDPALLLMIVGILMFFMTFCGCVGSLRENICLLQTFCICLTIIFLLQLVAGVLGFVFSDKNTTEDILKNVINQTATAAIYFYCMDTKPMQARGKVTDMVNNAITHYRDDLDLQNLIDYGQKQFNCCGGISYMDWSQNMYFNCSQENLSRERCSVPYSCCLLAKDETVIINTMCGQDMQKMNYHAASAFINTSGCIDKVVNWIHSNLFLLGGIALGLAIPQLVGILLSQILINQIQDQIKLQNYNLQHSSDPWS